MISCKEKDIYDVFMFFNENDLLEIRLNEHWDFVKKFIIIESLQTHMGNPKPQNFDKERFEKYSEKLHYILIDSIDDLSSKEFLPQNYFEKRRAVRKLEGLVRDNKQINYSLKILEELGVQDDDQIIVSCLDEIISARAISKLSKSVDSITSIELKAYIYKLNAFWANIVGPVITSYRVCKLFYPSETRNHPSMEASPFHLLFEEGGTVHNAGWHFCAAAKNAEGLRSKYTSMAHSEDIDISTGKLLFEGVKDGTHEEVEKRVLEIINMDDLIDNPSKYLVEIDESYPKFLRENLELYKDYILKP
tara:strand:+ start:2158 stop:3072 length:915 start_codon:yes stop_codon:yes gene_type:complete